MTTPEPEAQHVVPIDDYEALQEELQRLNDQLYPPTPQVRVSIGDRWGVFDPRNPDDATAGANHVELELAAALLGAAQRFYADAAARTKATDYPPPVVDSLVRDELLELYRRLER